MINVTEKYKEYIQKPNRYFKSKVIIRDKEYTDDTIIEMNQEESVNTGDDFTLGSVSSTRFSVILNEDIEFLETAILKPYIGLDIEGKIEYLPLGIFNVDDVSRKNKTIKIECFDNMIKLEQAYFSDLVYPAKIQDVALEICNKAGVKFNSTLPNYSIDKLEGYSLREAIGFIASLCCGFAKFNRYGELEIKFYNDINKIITPDNYFDFETGDKEFKISKVSAQNDKEILSLGNEGEFGKEVAFENPVITKAILQDIYNKLNGYTYMPYTLKWQGDMALEAGDCITIVDLKGSKYKTLVMQNKISYKGGLSAESKAVGKTEQGNKFSSNGSNGSKMNRLVTEQAFIKEALINKANIEDLKATNAVIENLSVETGKINNLLAGNITAKNITAGAITAGSGIIAEGAIGDAQISSLSANKIESGEVNTSKVKIKSNEGYLFIENNTLFVVDKNKQIRTELGAIENDSKFGLIVRGEDGKTILIDHKGVHNAGITDGAIDNRKVSENANISGYKLDIDSVIRNVNENGKVTIEGTKVKVGNTTLDVELSRQQQNITDTQAQLGVSKTQIQANTEGLKAKIDTQKYNKDMEGVNTSLNKNTTELGLLRDQINLKVSSTEVDKKISEINIGGRNLVKNSSGNLKNTSYWSSNTKLTKDGYNGNYAVCMERDGVAVGDPRMLITQKLDLPKVLKGEEYTIGVWVWVSSAINQDLDCELFIRCFHDTGFKDFCRVFIQPTIPRDKWIFLTATSVIDADYKKEIDLHGAIGRNGRVYFSEIMLSKGNKVPSWTPAPEDLEYSVNKYTDGKITTVTEKINSTQSEVNVLKNQINLKVSSSEVDTKISNIQVGGVNKIPKTDFYKSSNLSSWSTWGYWEYKPFGDKGALKVSSKSHPKNTVGGIISPKVIGGLQKDREYCLSLKTTSSSNTTKLDYCYILDLDTNINEKLPVMVVNQWDLDIDKALSYMVFKPTKEYPNCKMLIGREAGEVDNQNITGFLLKDVQLEEGNKCTPWSPAPGDIVEEFNKLDTNINQKVSEIKIEQDKITSTVSSVQGTLNNKADKGQLTGLESKLTQTINDFKFEFIKTQKGNLIENGKLQGNFQSWNFWGGLLPYRIYKSDVGAFVANPTPNPGVLYQDNVKLKPNTEYTIGLKGWKESNVRDFSIVIDYLNEKGISLDSQSFPLKLNDQRETYTFTTKNPSGLKYIKFAFYTSGSNHTSSSIVTYLSEVSVREGKLGDYVSHDEEINNNVTTINSNGVTVSHKDGSYSQISSKGFYRYDSGEEKEYFFTNRVLSTGLREISCSSQASGWVGDSFSTTLPIPEDLKNKQIAIIPVIRNKLSMGEGNLLFAQDGVSANRSGNNISIYAPIYGYYAKGDGSWAQVLPNRSFQFRISIDVILIA